MFESTGDLVGILLMGLLFVAASVAGLALLAYHVIKRLSPSKRREEPLEADREQWSEELLEVDDEESGVVPGPETKPRLTSLPLYYDLLGLSPEAKPGEVLTAYREGVEGSNPASLPEGSEARRNAEERLQSIKVALHRIRKTWPEDDQQMAEAFEQAATERDDIGPGSRSADRAFPKNLLGLSPKEAETGQQFVRGAMFFWTLLLLGGAVVITINWFRDPPELRGSPFSGIWNVGIWYLGWRGLRALDKRLEPGASRRVGSRAHDVLSKLRNRTGLAGGSELRQDGLHSRPVALQETQATWPEDVQPTVEAYEQDDDSSAEPGVLLPAGKRLRLPTLFDFTDKQPWVRKAVSSWTFLCGAALTFLGLGFLTNPGWFGLIVMSPVALLVAGAWYVGVKLFMRLGRS